MMRNNITNKKILSAVLALQMLFSVVLFAATPAFAAQNVVVISSTEDFVKFSKKCTLDSYSEGKKVSLAQDIDFSKTDFVPVATFGGTFEGNGHKIFGIKFDSKGSHMGVFRYVGQNGNISGLCVEGDFLPEGSKSFVGGIVGENNGTLENCSFKGNVSGENVVGGIAGENKENGKIVNCSASGNITGENSTGGIAGKNSGFIQKCTNHCLVNTVYEEKKSEVSNLDTDMGAVVENYKIGEEENEEKSVLGHSDTGGIAGLSTGILQGCTNNGAVGYKHMGYNVGGIAGRQSGYILGCENHGVIQGRKDVGGIVGQAEPYILLSASDSILHDLREELENLHTDVNKFITDTENLGDNAKKHLDGISDYASEAGDNAEIMLNSGQAFVDDNVAEINAQAAVLSNTVDKLVPVFESLESGGENLTQALSEISDALEDMELNLPELSDDIKDIGDALDEITKAEGNIRRAVTRFENVKGALERAVQFKSEAEVKNAVSKLSGAVEDIINAKRSTKEAVEEIENIIKSDSKNFENMGADAKKILECLKTIKDNTEITVKSLGTIKTSLDTMILNTNIYFSEFKNAAENMEEAMDYLSRAMHYITGGFDDLADAIKDISDSLSGFANDFNEDFADAADRLAKGFEDLSYASDDLADALSDMKDIIKDLSNENDPNFVKLGDDFKNASESLFDSLSGISDEMTKLKDVLSEDGDKLTKNLSSLNNRFNLIMNLLLDEVDEIKNGAKSLSDIFVDVSDEDIESIKQGKVKECKNFGSVEADRNIGGIVGAVAIEYSKDPEDEIEKPDSLNFTYTTRAVIEACINNGTVTGKKDCAGGIAGLEEIGTVYRCENYGDTESTNGNYTGGIVGKSSSAVRRSYAKCTVSGKRYAGGIAGKAERVASSYAIAKILGEENTGAICGDCENKDKLYQNFYTDNGLGAVDGISYKEKAEPCEFEDFKKMSGVPSRFMSFSVTFVADGKTVESQSVEYGESTKKIRFPEVPEKKGKFGNWKPIKDEYVKEDIKVECEYKPYITVISSPQKNESGKLSLALCTGEFDDRAHISISQSKQKPPSGVGGDTKIYDISLYKSKIAEDEKCELRLLNENKDKASVWLLKNGEWQKVKTSNRGKYVVFNGEGAKNTVCVKYEKKGAAISAVIILFVLALCAGVLIFKTKRKKKSNKTKK